MIALVILEKLRSPNKHFDIRYLKSLTNFQQVRKYAEECGLKSFEDIGSSRLVFVLSSSKVLKVAKSEAGIEQNEIEIKVRQSTDSDILTKIFDYDSKFRWIIAELVKPFKSSTEFMKAAGSDAYFFDRAARIYDDTHDLDDVRQRYEQDGYENWELFSHNFMNIFDIANEFNITDLSYTNYGTTADGRLVILDYGLTE